VLVAVEYVTIMVRPFAAQSAFGCPLESQYARIFPRRVTGLDVGIMNAAPSAGAMVMFGNSAGSNHIGNCGVYFLGSGGVDKTAAIHIKWTFDF
jgi:hypothetical protein